MRKLRLFVICLLFASAHASATPRTLTLEESQIDFTVKEMGVPVPGKFKRFEGTFDIDAAMPEKSSFLLRIDVGTLATGNEEADELAVGKDWLDKVHAPYATFKSVSIRALSGGRYETKGLLNIRNKEREITIQFTSTDQANGKTVIAGDFIIKRSEFGIGAGIWNQPGVVAEEIPVKVRLALVSATGKLPAPASR